MTPNTAREKLETKIPRKPSHPSRIPKPAKEAASSSTASHPLSSHDSSGDSTAESQGEVHQRQLPSPTDLHQEQQWPLESGDTVETLPEAEAETSSGMNPPQKQKPTATRGARGGGSRASLGSSQQQQSQMMPPQPLPPQRNTRSSRRASGTSSDLSDHIYAKANVSPPFPALEPPPPSSPPRSSFRCCCCSCSGPLLSFNSIGEDVVETRS